jgi:hypothetical protein
MTSDRRCSKQFAQRCSIADDDSEFDYFFASWMTP